MTTTRVAERHLDNLEDKKYNLSQRLAEIGGIVGDRQVTYIPSRLAFCSCLAGRLQKYLRGAVVLIQRAQPTPDECSA